MRLLVKGLFVWLTAYLAVLILFITFASVMAPSNRDPSTYGSSDLMGIMTFIAKLAGASIPALLLGKVMGKAGVFFAVALMIAVFVLAQVLPGGFIVLSIFSGEPPAMAALYALIAGLSAMTMVRRSGRSQGKG